MKKILAGALLASTITAGGFAAAAVAPIVSAGAQEKATTTQSQASEARPGRLATAEHKGVTEVLQGLVADGTLTQEQADRVAAALEAARPDGDHRPGAGHGEGMRAAFDAAAGVLDMSPEDLRAELQGGKTLAEVAEAHGVTLEDITAAVTDSIKTHIADEVAKGELTQDQADKMLSNLTEHVDHLVTKAPGAHGDHQAPNVSPADGQLGDDEVQSQTQADGTPSAQSGPEAHGRDQGGRPGRGGARGPARDSQAG